MYKYLKSGCKEDGARLLTVVFSVSTRGNRHKLEHWKFCLNIRKQFAILMTEHSNRLPKDATKTSPSLEIYKSLGSLF